MTTRSEIAARLAAATPGPWAYEAHGDTGIYGVGLLLDENDNPVSGQQESGAMLVAEPVAIEVARQTDARFIAHAREDIPFLLREIAEREARLATARERIAYLEEQEGRRGQSTHSELCWQWHPECARLRVEAAEAKVAGLSRLLGDADEIITWMSGSMDFGPNGQAHQGWLKMQERIIEIRAALAGTSDTGVAG